jgi:Protein of unknown function (DUF1579)
LQGLVPHRQGNFGVFVRWNLRQFVFFLFSKEFIMRTMGWLAVLSLVCAFTSSAVAQGPTATKEHKHLAADVGDWTAELKVWMGADGKADPNAEPQSMKGEESNRMLGDFWLVSSFKGDFGGMPFEGHSLTGYDVDRKKYVASWTDSMSPFAMHMEGTYDESTKTMTMMSKGKDMTGKETVGKTVSTWKDADTRVFTMYELKEGTKDEFIKSMEITYKRKAKEAKPSKGSS